MHDSGTGDRDLDDDEDEAPEGAAKSRVDELLEGAAAGEDDDRLDAGDRKMLADITAKVLGTTAPQVRIGRFRVLRELGQGSMGKVYAALDPHSSRIITLKVHPSAEPSERERRRMLQEARALAQLQHDNVVRVYEAGEHRGQIFVAMELVEGRTLREIQDERPSRSWRDLVSLYLMAGRGLQAAHDQQIVHRDFKPSSVVVGVDDRVQVFDFGLARAPAYVAPELFEWAARATARSDQFSFCAALYEAVYGQRPFEAVCGGELRPPPRGSSPPSWLFGILRKGLSVAPEDRHPSMEVLLQEIEHRLTSRWKTWLTLLLPLGAVAVLDASILLGFGQARGADRIDASDWYRVELTEAVRMRSSMPPNCRPPGHGSAKVPRPGA
ncbi:MAG: serine/threonine-protein kinase [Myxococcota bacterium]